MHHHRPTPLTTCQFLQVSVPSCLLQSCPSEARSNTDSTGKPKGTALFQTSGAMAGILTEAQLRDFLSLSETTQELRCR